MNWDLWRSHLCLLSFLFIMIVGRNFVTGISKFKPKNLKKLTNLKVYFLF